MPALQEHLLELAWLPGFPMSEETSDCVFVCVSAYACVCVCQQLADMSG